MKHKILALGLAIVIGFGGFVLFLGLVTHPGRASPAFFSSRQVGGDGLGDPGNNQIPSLAVFGDYLYAGTWHTDLTTTTAQIWRSLDGTTWQKVDDRHVNGAAALIPFNGSLFAGSWNGFIWSSSNGITWTEIITDGFGSPGQGIARFMLFGDSLYASTWNSTTGTEVWRTSNGTGWTQFIDAGLTHNPNNSAAISSEVFGGALYMGIVNEGTGAQLWRSDGITTTAVMTDGFGNPENLGISSLAMFNGWLYAGTDNPQGVQVWRSANGTDWERIPETFSAPFSNLENALEVFDGQLYLAVANYSTGIEVWRTANGANWEQVATSGFGNPYNKNPYWDNGLTVFKDKLYVGVTNWQSGGEIWQMIVNPMKTYLPCITRGCLSTYHDNFSDPSSGWPIGEDSIAKLGYTNGEYQIMIKDPRYLVYAYKEFQEKDVQIELDMRPVSHLNGATGIVFSRSSLGYYLLDVSENWFTLWKRDSINGVWTMLIDWTPSPYLYQGYMSNHIKIARNGDDITIYGNGVFLAMVTDSSLHGTGIGMESEAFSGYPNYDGRFDNLSVYPGCFPAQLLSIPGAQTSLNLMYSMDPGIGGPTP